MTIDQPHAHAHLYNQGNPQMQGGGRMDQDEEWGVEEAFTQREGGSRVILRISSAPKYNLKVAWLTPGTGHDHYTSKVIN